MRVSATILGFVAATALTVSPVFAQGHGAGSHGKAHTSAKPATTGKPAKAASGRPAAAKTTATSTTTSTRRLNPIAAKIASKPNLNAKLTGMLPMDPATGRTMTLNKASRGFKNQGQFIAALHVSQNLGIPFADLKSHMVTVTPGAPGQRPTATQTGSLGQAIQASKATAAVTTEVERAQTQSAADLQSTSTRKSTKKPTTGGSR